LNQGLFCYNRQLWHGQVTGQPGQARSDGGNQALVQLRMGRHTQATERGLGELQEACRDNDVTIRVTPDRLLGLAPLAPAQR